MLEQLGLGSEKKSKTINREERTEIFLRFLHSAENIKSLHGAKIEEIFSNEEKKRNFIEDLQENEFIELLNGTNGILRGKNKNEWNMDGDGVTIESPIMGTSYFPPRQEDKSELLVKVLAAAKEMNRSEKDLKDIALLVSASLNAIHPYADANGRTGRFIYLLLSKNFDNKTLTELQQVLGEYGRDNLNISPRDIQWNIRNIIENEVGINDPEANKEKISNLFFHIKKIKFSNEITNKDQELFSTLLNQDARYLFFSIFQYLQSQKDKDKYLRKFPDRSAILVDSLSKDLTPENLSKIFQNYRELKKNYVEKLIDSVAHSEKSDYQFEYNGEKISFKDYFELMIEKESEK